jgi:hypothetical protein
MNRTWIAVIVLVVAVALPSGMFAHAGHPHRFMGTVSAADAEQIEVETKDGTVLTFVLDEKTIYRQGKTKVVGKLPKVGERVVVSAMEVEEGQTMTAETVQLPVPATASR